MSLIAFILNVPYTLLGFILALISIPRDLKFNINSPAFIFNVRKFWWTAAYLKGARAMTIGHVVLLGPNSHDKDLEHELIHVEQYQRAPFIHPILYYVELIRKGYLDNQYEVEAYQKAGNIYNVAKDKWSKKMSKNRVSAIIIKDGKILLIHRFKGGKEYWVLPGGSVEAGESNEEALDREVEEELSLKVVNKKYLFQIENSGRQEYHYLVGEYSGTIGLGGPEKEKMSEQNQYILEWVDLSRVDQLEDFYPPGIGGEILRLNK